MFFKGCVCHSYFTVMYSTFSDRKRLWATIFRGGEKRGWNCIKCNKSVTHCCCKAKPSWPAVPFFLVIHIWTCVFCYAKFILFCVTCWPLLSFEQFLWWKSSCVILHVSSIPSERPSHGNIAGSQSSLVQKNFLLCQGRSISDLLRGHDLKKVAVLRAFIYLLSIESTVCDRPGNVEDAMWSTHEFLKWFLSLGKVYWCHCTFMVTNLCSRWWTLLF